MRFQGSVLKEQGVTFAIVIVKSHILNNSSEREDARDSFRYVFPGVPIILMAQDSRGVPTYHGRTDIVNFLANVPVHAIPWKEYSLN